MPEPPRRSRFQFNLSTAIIAVAVTGALLYLNIRPAHESAIFNDPGAKPEAVIIQRTWLLGWPVRMEYKYERVARLQGQAAIDVWNRAEYQFPDGLLEKLYITEWYRYAPGYTWFAGPIALALCLLINGGVYAYFLWMVIMICRMIRRVEHNSSWLGQGNE